MQLVCDSESHPFVKEMFLKFASVGVTRPMYRQKRKHIPQLQLKKTRNKNVNHERLVEL